ncbi:TerD family protein, partial [Streptomyces globisporus]|uniref:TerD family protein n=1 Tax=Streptomyces globisporus TaxID=1908 RepID=UPI0004CB44E0
MTAELVRGQNRPLPETRLEIRVSAGHPVLAGAALGDEQGRVAGAEWIAHPGAPSLPGVDVPAGAAADHRLVVDLEAVPGAVHRVSVLLALTGGAVRFGALAAPFVAVAGSDGTEIVSYTITGLDTESAVVALELYRRQGAWKVRAMGQGYAGGLAALLADQGLERPPDLAATILATESPAPIPAPTGPAPVASAAADPSSAAASPAEPSPVASSRVPEPERVRHTAPPAAPDPAPASPAPVTGAGTGGPVDYSHPRRRPAPAEPA